MTYYVMILVTYQLILLPGLKYNCSYLVLVVLLNYSCYFWMINVYGNLLISVED